MTFAWAPRILRGTLIIGAVGACSANNAGPETATPVGSTISVAFDDSSGVLDVAPSNGVDIPLTITGPDAIVSVELEGAYDDGSLIGAMVQTTNGHGTVRLQTPSHAATFDLRAQLPGAPDARLDVSVSATGYTQVRLQPAYAGPRAVGEVTASAFVGTSCAAILKTAIHDGSLVETGTVDAPITLSNVPQGAGLVISLRIAHYARGCAEINATTATVMLADPVSLYDIPMALDATDLEATFGFVPASNEDTAAWDSIETGAFRLVADGFVPPTDPEEKTLLDAMQYAVPSDNRDAFATARAAEDWDTAAGTWITSVLRGDTIHTHVNTLLATAFPTAPAQFTAHIGAGSMSGSATFTPETFFGQSASSAEFLSLSTFDWTADADDNVHLAGSLSFIPALTAARTGDAWAGKHVINATGVSSAIGIAIDCDGLASQLVGSGTAYPGCNATCTAMLCQTALDARWVTALARAGNGPPNTIMLTMSAAAGAGEFAEPTNFTGAWVGITAGHGIDFDVTGSATATSASAH